MNAAQTYVNSLADNLTKITMTEFFQNIHDQFYPDLHIKFMEYFLVLAKHNKEFIVHHSKLAEYGVMTSTESGNVKKKLTALGLTEGTDYELVDVYELRKQGGTSNKKHYHLLPKAFKKCLMRAQRRANQPIDPTIYCDYYLLLEDVFQLYTDYERKFAEVTIQMANNKIKFADMFGRLQMTSLHKKIDQERELAQKERELAKQRDAEQQRKIDELLGYAYETKTELGEVRVELHDIHNELVETKEIADLSRLHLEDKSFTSTMNPSDPDLHHYFAGTKTIVGNQTRVKFIRAQKGYMDKRLSNPNIDVEIKPFYTANGIDLGNNCLKEFQKRRKELVKRINAENAFSDKEHNQRLLKEINAANKINAIKRVYMEEKRVTRKITNNDILVNFKKLSFTYTHNPYMSYENVIQIIKDVHNTTQQSPVP